jgi:hypothetical protein
VKSNFSEITASIDNTKSFDLTTVSINTDLTSLTTLSVTLIPLPALICCTLLLISGVNLSSKTLSACANDPTTKSTPKSKIEEYVQRID